MTRSPSASDIRQAKSKAVGGGRKRCRKGKNCSAACIAAGDDCLVTLPEPVSVEVSKMRNYLRGKVIVRGTAGGGKIQEGLDIDRKAGLTKTDLDNMQRNYDRYVKTGTLGFPFKIPTNYDDRSGTNEAVAEITSMRGKLKQDKKTGNIEIPAKTKLSPKSLELIKEWNALDKSNLYTAGLTGTALNVGGLGVGAGPRNSVPKDAVRGLVQYVALRRQQAEVVQGPDGTKITSYRDPFTGQRRPFEVNGKIAASQDHWEKPFGIYGIRSENDAKNTVYMPASMNSNKGEASPGRYVFETLVKNGRLQDTVSVDKGAVGGFAGRYDRNPSKDFLPKGFTRDSEKQALRDKSTEMINIANNQINSKVVGGAKKLAAGDPTLTQVANVLTNIAKYESKTNYFGGELRFGDGRRILTPYEQNLVKGINLNGPKPKLEKSIIEALEKSGKSPRELLSEILQNREGYVPTPTK